MACVFWTHSGITCTYTQNIRMLHIISHSHAPRQLSTYTQKRAERNLYGISSLIENIQCRHCVWATLEIGKLIKNGTNKRECIDTPSDTNTQKQWMEYK